MTFFTQRNFVVDFLQAKCDFRRKAAVLRYEPPLGDLGWGQHTMIILGSLESAYFLNIISLQEVICDSIIGRSALSLRMSPKGWSPSPSPHGSNLSPSRLHLSIS